MNPVALRFALAGVLGCILIAGRRPLSTAASKIGFPPFYPVSEAQRIRLFTMIGVVFVLIGFGAAAISLFAAQ